MGWFSKREEKRRAKALVEAQKVETVESIKQLNEEAAHVMTQMRQRYTSHNQLRQRVWSSEHPVIQLNDIKNLDILRSGYFVIESGADCVELIIPINCKGVVSTNSQTLTFDVLTTPGREVVLSQVPLDPVGFHAYANDEVPDEDVEAARAALEALMT